VDSYIDKTTDNIQSTTFITHLLILTSKVCMAALMDFFANWIYLSTFEWYAENGRGKKKTAKGLFSSLLCFLLCFAPGCGITILFILMLDQYSCDQLVGDIVLPFAITLCVKAVMYGIALQLVKYFCYTHCGEEIQIENKSLISVNSN